MIGTSTKYGARIVAVMMVVLAQNAILSLTTFGVLARLLKRAMSTTSNVPWRTVQKAAVVPAPAGERPKLFLTLECGHREEYAMKLVTRVVCAECWREMDSPQREDLML